LKLRLELVVMAPKPLDILKKGLAKIKAKLETKRKEIERKIALSTINRYTEGMCTLLARKLEVLADALNRQLRLEETRSMKDGLLTDYFKRS